MPKPFYTPLQQKTISQQQDLSVDDIQQLIHMLTDRWVDKTRIKGALKVLKSKTI